jgi:N utilization substance protein B
MSKRRYARERAMQALYAQALAGGDPAHTIKTVITPRLHDDKATFEFAVNLFQKSVDYEQEATEIIEKHTQNWELGRIAVIDRILIQMAIVEFLFVDDVPPKVTMNELIEIAKRYSTDRSAPFVNGILDAILESLKSEGRIVKTGRGLIGMDDNPKTAP